jgi:hypothetical protein
VCLGVMNGFYPSRKQKKVSLPPHNKGPRRALCRGGKLSCRYSPSNSTDSLVRSSLWITVNGNAHKTFMTFIKQGLAVAFTLLFFCGVISCSKDELLLPSGETDIQQNSLPVFGGQPSTGVSCSYDQGHWFAGNELNWPDVNGRDQDGQVMVGQQNYTAAQGRKIWRMSNKNGVDDIKQLYLHVTAIKLSSVSDKSAIWPWVMEADFQLMQLMMPVDQYLELSATQKASAAQYVEMDKVPAMTMILSNWIQANPCEVAPVATSTARIR